MVLWDNYYVIYIAIAKDGFNQRIHHLLVLILSLMLSLFSFYFHYYVKLNIRNLQPFKINPQIYDHF